MITFLSQPNTIEPVYGNLVFQFISTAATDPSYYKYRYVVDVFTDEGQIAQLKITPSSEGWGQLDLSPILLNYTASQPANQGCSGDTSLHLAAWGYLKDNMIVYSIMVGEEYSLIPNGVVSFYDGNGQVGQPSIRSNVGYSYNGVKEWFNGKQYNFNPFYLTGSTGTFPQYTSRFMTNSPRTRWIRPTDYATLGALNYYDIAVDLPARQVYSAIFKFYDEDNVLISTGRTFNVYANCGTRPSCNYYDHYWTNPTNFAEEQVIYVGAGVPNITEHGINFPNGVKYYSVELEGTLDQPEPPEPEIDVFDGCSCFNYSITNLGEEAQLSITYLDCLGVQQSELIDPLSSFNYCACQNSTRFLNDSPRIFTNNGECDACVCLTYRVFNPDPDFPIVFSYTSCSGSTETGSIPPDDFVDVCACEDTISGATFSVLGDCPIPFSGDCVEYGVSSNVEYVLNITYTGCCGTILTFAIPPLVGVQLCANDPFPTSVLWDAVDLGECPGATPCPTPTPTPTPIPLPTGAPLIGRNLCDDTLMYFSYTGDTIVVGQYFNYQDVPYEIIGIGGGGFVPLDNPYIFDSEAEVLSAFPCPIFSGGTCLPTIVISEPFYFYLDGECSPGEGNQLIYFLNKMGTWDSYNFRAKQDTGYSIEKQVYQSAPTLYSEGWDSTSYYGWNSRRNVWNQVVAQSGVIYTSYMPESEMLWLSEELFQSPSVYLIQEDGTPMPIILSQTEIVKPNYQIGSSKYQINIEYKSAYDTIRQNHE